jgi:predicted dienelactone hydrolase
MKRSPVCSLSIALMLASAACGDDTPGATAEPDGTASDVLTDVAAAEVLSETLDPADAVPDSEEASEVTPDTPYRVGYRSSSLTYRPADGSGERTLRLAWWYPTLDLAGGEVAYLDGVVPRPEVLGDAAPVARPAPMVVFSHGNAAFAEQSWFLTEHLASRGFLVVAPDHTGNTFTDGVDATMFRRRPEDVSAVIDHLEALPEDDPLAPLVGDALAVAGHSFGGYTALAVGGAAWDVDAVIAYCRTQTIPLDGCASLIADEAAYRAGFLDPRIDALIPMSPGIVAVFGADGLGGITKPTLLVTGARDRTTSNASDGDPAWRQLDDSPDNLRIDFANAGHFTFSDACALPIGIGRDDGCGESFIAPDQAHAAVNAYALAFLRLHLLADDSGRPLLDGSVTIEPDVTVSHGASD